jgi:asparagine synthase (glutamine-hydrolysing)
MCGLVGIATRDGETPAATTRDLLRMRDRLAHRGPDDSGTLLERNIGLAHTRLAIVDPSHAGRQPMRTPDGRFTLVYNGEIYNDADLRAPLRDDGVRFQTSCDTETVLHVLARGGADALPALRGMYALALHDRQQQTLLLARDPLGIKPLYYWRGTLAGSPHVVFASQIPAILAHPGISAHPDPTAVSAYLTTIRTVQGERTMYDGVRALRAGEWLRLDLRSPDLRQTRGTTAIPPAEPPADDERVRAVVADSIGRHMRADVPMCSLLSGGLDSTIIATEARGRAHGLRTSCAGCPSGANPPRPTAPPAPGWGR